MASQYLAFRKQETKEMRLINLLHRISTTCTFDILGWNYFTIAQHTVQSIQGHSMGKIFLPSFMIVNQGLSKTQKSNGQI